MVTSAPQLRYSDANSTPTAPAPRMIADAGTRFIFSASSLVRIALPSAGMPGSCLGRDPVAMITDPASTVIGSPVAGVTARRPGPSSRPRPLITLTLFLRSRNCTPL